MELERIAGLPAHPLLVHAAVVLVPLAAIALLATGWRRSWRQSFLLPVLGLALAGAVAAILAASSGEPLEHSVREAAKAAGENARFGEHPEEGEAAEIWSVAFAASVLAYAAVAQWWRSLSLPSWAPRAAYAGAGLLGVAATGFIVAAGHSGAQLVWKDVGSYAAGR